MTAITDDDREAAVAYTKTYALYDKSGEKAFLAGIEHERNRHAGEGDGWSGVGYATRKDDGEELEHIHCSINPEYYYRVQRKRKLLKLEEGKNG